jgi:hypothetical protein
MSALKSPSFDIIAREEGGRRENKKIYKLQYVKLSYFLKIQLNVDTYEKVTLQ